jgi:hypothetical protein
MEISVHDREEWDMEREPAAIPFDAVPPAPGPSFGQPGNPTHGPCQAALVLGILALVSNVLLIFVFFGVIFGIIAVFMGALNLHRHPYAKAGLILGILSFVPLAAYLLAIVTVIVADPMLLL